jgi:hypothetical protein
MLAAKLAAAVVVAAVWAVSCQDVTARKGSHLCRAGAAGTAATVATAATTATTALEAAAAAVAAAAAT